MASIFRRTRSRPIPDGAELVTNRSGQRFAKWTDKKTGRARKEPLNDAGDRVVIEAGSYLIAYVDASGKRVEVNSETPERATAEQIAAKLESEAALRRRGIIDADQEAMADAGRRPLAQHLADFQAGMMAAGRTDDHVSRTVGFIREILDAAGYVNLADIKADGINRFASDLTTEGKAARTIQARLTAVKSFTKWLAMHNKLNRDPLASVKKPNPAADRRHERRMLLHEEWDWLRATTEQGPERYGMTGHERMLLYAVAIQSGLRSGECRSLTRGRLMLDDGQPYIVCKARSTKNKKDARQYIQPGLAAELAQHIGTKAPAAPVFSMPEETNVARMFRKDLADARRAWLGSTQDPAERLRREQSDFLQPANHDGEKADFHSLRHTTGAWLALAGVHPKVVQTVMRHSSITLTMDTYGHLFPGQDAQAVASLPDIMGDDSDQDAKRATGTDGRLHGVSKWPANGQHSSRDTAQNVAGSCEPDKDSQNGDGQPNVLPYNALSSKGRNVAERGGNRPGGIRTPDQGIMSPLLSPLSYGPFHGFSWFLLLHRTELSYRMKSVEELFKHYFSEVQNRWPDPPSRGGTARAASTEL